MIKFNKHEWTLFRRLQRKHKVSTEFLHYNLANIQKIIWYQTWPRIIIKRFAVRRRNRIYLQHYRLRRVLFDQANRRIIKRMRQNIKQWSRSIVFYRKRTQEPEEYVEETICKEKEPAEAAAPVNNSVDDVSKQLKEQLELLKSGRRQKPLIEANNENRITTNDVVDSRQKSPEERATTNRTSLEENVTSTTSGHNDWQINLESTPEKQLATIQANVQPIKLLASDEKTEKSHHEDEMMVYGQNIEKPMKSGLNFLDMLMSKVGSSVVQGSRPLEQTPNSNDTLTNQQHHHSEHSSDSCDGFLGFDDNERIPGMLMTPIVPNSIKSNNSIFVSETLNEYMRQNDLETDYNIDKDKSFKRVQSRPTDLEGLMTPKTQPPHLDMPAVPDNLLRFRTVAERKNYLQKFAKNSRLSIINNEACIYRELQKRIRYQKCKPNSQQLTAQSNSSSMSFTRNGWMAASFINTEFNKYYYQMLDVDEGKYKVKLRGVRGNNDEFRKKPYLSKVKNPPKTCPRLCVDEDMWHDFKVIKTVSPKSRKLNKEPLPSVFKPCPLSHKTLQKPLDDDAAALLLAGGSMAVVRMPTVELEVFPECGKPLNEIAKRYLQYILPHHDISREWAEFSVSTLKLPGSLRDAVKAATDSIPRKSFTFVIPYLNDRNHVLVRRVVDRSEKLDESFEQCLDTELVPKADFTFRKNLDTTADDVLLTCADVVSDMINTVAISCSENSFIKDDPDMMCEEEIADDIKSPCVKTEKTTNRPSSAASNSGETKKRTKQNRVLLELRRLNATIIDAAVKPEKEKKPCHLEYCAMGCVCDSLAEEAHVREHCGKTKCMWECTCKTSNQSRILRLETDGRTITTEDAFMLRRKATARLARMEKEFTSTVVLTENETLLINETNNDKKRRCTKAPKRYEYYEDDTDDELSRQNSPKKTALTTIDNEKNLAVEVKEIREPVYIQDTVLEQLKHCTVNLVRLKDMDNVAPWCLVHNLYKCFCKGKALEGKPMIIEKGENNTTIEHGGDRDQQQTMLLTPTDYKATTTKARYTFEKVEKSKSKSKDLAESESEESEDNDSSYEQPGAPSKTQHTLKQRRSDYGKPRRSYNTHKKEEPEKREKEKPPQKSSYVKENSKQSQEPASESQTQSDKPKRSLEEVRERFFAPRPEGCRRLIPIPRRMFLYCNRKRRINVLNYIKENETEQTRLLLNEHVMRSVYYHKADNEKMKKQQEQQEANKAAKEKDSHGVGGGKTKQQQQINDEVKDQPQPHDIVDLIDDDDENEVIQKEAVDMPSKLKITASAMDDDSAIVQDAVSSPDAIITMKEFGTLSGLNIAECNASAAEGTSTNSSTALNSPAENTELMLPKISNCFSLNAKANISKTLTGSTADVQKLKQHLADLTSVTSVNSPVFAAPDSADSNMPNSTLMDVNSQQTDPSDSAQLSLLTENENVRDVYNSVIRTMNSLVSKKMQDVDFALKRESHIIPAPNTDILCIMKWSNFLDAFCRGFAFIWQVKSKEGTYLVATIRNMMPMICGAMGVVNITALKPDRVPLMAKMLLHNVRNEHTTKLAIVMQGKLTYWVVKGFLKADPAMACNKPTPETHPSLTKKINILCTSLVKQRQKEEKKKQQQMLNKKSNLQNNLVVESATNVIGGGVGGSGMMMSESVTMTLNTPITPLPPPYAGSHQTLPNIFQTPISTQPPQACNVIGIPPVMGGNQIIPNTPVSIIPSPLPDTNPRKRKFTSDPILSNEISSNKMDSYAKMSTNIEFRKVTPQDVNEIHLPHDHKDNHKWLVLDLHNDFSHIFVPDFRDLVSLDRIQKVINFAKQKNKIVKLQFFQNAPFDAFVTPKSGRKIYFGPLNMNMKPPTLILLQSVDGQMMLRELYQLKHGIQTPADERTKAFWLLQMNGQTHFEIEPTSTAYNENYVKTIAMESVQSPEERQVLGQQDNAMRGNAEANDTDDDEDCMIIDEVDNNPAASSSKASNAPHSAESYKYFTISSVANDLQITPATTIAAQPPPATTSNNSLLKIAQTNTVIQPILQLPPVVNPAAQQSFLNLPTNSIISGVVTLANNSTATATATVVPTQLPAPPAPSSVATFLGTPPATIQNINQLSKNSAAATTTVLKTPQTYTTKDIIIPNSSNTSNTGASSTTYTQQPIAQKRRRVSIVCQNPFDRVSHNIAVSAVINKILPENIQDIQVDQPLSTVSTIGSTTITKLSDNITHLNAAAGGGGTTTTFSNISTKLPTAPPPTPPSNANTKPSKPLVFDVSFVDGDEEPAASIVIKPNSSPQKSAVAATTHNMSISQTLTSSTITTNTTGGGGVGIPSAKFCIKSARGVPYKVVKIPPSSLPVMTSSSGYSNAQLQNRLVYSSKVNNSNITTNTTTTTTTNIGSPSSIALQQPKKVLNTTNPIKISGMSSIGSPSATIQLIPSGSVRIAATKQPPPLSLPSTGVASQTQTIQTSSAAKSLTIAALPKVTATTGSGTSSTTATSVTYSKLQPAISTTTSAQTSTTNINPVTSPITSSTATNSTSNSGLTITSVQSFGVSPMLKKPSTAAIQQQTSTPIQTAAASHGIKRSPQRPISSPAATNVDKSSAAAESNAKSLMAKEQSSANPNRFENSNAPSSGIATLPPHIQYGYIVSPNYTECKFVAKRVMDEFYVKVPTVGILKLIGLSAVNNYLNK
ncbi:uncharacterized protein LOC133337925 [Musca vetustissima]|uniref:uncharacterized protein LOC133337925 n=1 Tax=Musca vetustissima TaxID=27455 RepID=UPI002AB6838C|nr:uncharacterized protein LOC133337925 [Musca vetustissima]